MNDPYTYNMPFLCYSREYWLKEQTFCWTLEEIESADENNGFIGNKFSFDCYVWKPLAVGTRIKNKSHIPWLRGK